MKMKYILSIDGMKIGFNKPQEIYIVLIKLYPDIANKEKAKNHIFRICNAIDNDIEFDLINNRPYFAIGGFGAPNYVGIRKN